MNSKPDGRALMEWLDPLIKRSQAGSRDAWADKVDKVSAATLSRWADGLSTPTLETMSAVARGLGRSLTDVLLAAHVLDPAEVEGYVVPPVEVLTPERAIEEDAELPPELKRMLADMLGTLRQLARGEGGDASGEVIMR